MRPADWNYERAAHLIERAGFGGTPAEVARLAAMTPREAVNYLVEYESIDNGHLKPFEESPIWDPGMDPFPKSRADAVRQARERGESMGVKVNTEGSRRLQPVVNKFFYLLRANALEDRRAVLWWANRMLSTKRPLEEKMALFWHGHFATGDTKVRDCRKMIIQLDLFHTYATGNFRDLLLGVTKDPGMLAYLDNAENVEEHPNENFGRELMELFSMGIGNYTEQDVREASRAFTGWTDDRLTFVARPELHDDGVKTVLGRTGNFDGEDIIDIIAEQPATAAFISGKLYRYFVREELVAEVHDRLAERLRESAYELKPLLKTIFLSKDFYSPPSVATQIKTPVHLVVSTYKKLGLSEVPTIPDFSSATGALGQSLFNPPNVAGWAGGRTWITPATLFQRGNFAHQVLFPKVEASDTSKRTMPSIYRVVGEKLAQGLNITQATMSGDSSFNKMADADEDYNTRYGGYMGYIMAYEVVPPIPRFPAAVDLTAMLRREEILTTEATVDYFLRRFLSVPLKADDRTVLVSFLDQQLGGEAIDFSAPDLETSLRYLLHLILSAPEYQLS
ncbi:MAG: DUF1800 domain-containing protein [Candidatus Hydrogenedentes bacterium]|nr:DUF1800 domain-containing protein [Candidatus Hydrogenedentota bacterium]